MVLLTFLTQTYHGLDPKVSQIKWTCFNVVTQKSLYFPYRGAAVLRSRSAVSAKAHRTHAVAVTLTVWNRHRLYNITDSTALCAVNMDDADLKHTNFTGQEDPMERWTNYCEKHLHVWRTHVRCFITAGCRTHSSPEINPHDGCMSGVLAAHTHTHIHRCLLHSKLKQDNNLPSPGTFCGKSCCFGCRHT